MYECVHACDGQQRQPGGVEKGGGRYIGWSGPVVFVSYQSYDVASSSSSSFSSIIILFVLFPLSARHIRIVELTARSV